MIPYSCTTCSFVLGSGPLTSELTGDHLIGWKRSSRLLLRYEGCCISSIGRFNCCSKDALSLFQTVARKVRFQSMLDVSSCREHPQANIFRRAKGGQRCFKEQVQPL